MAAVQSLTMLRRTRVKLRGAGGDDDSGEADGVVGLRSARYARAPLLRNREGMLGAVHWQGRLPQWFPIHLALLLPSSLSGRPLVPWGGYARFAILIASPNPRPELP
uniref:Uncharacterized protein n=1 Tax=Oryza sativa subsp. japonica TaxID=39947 RepID=Q10LT4_ORYSJ|nr:hypothetical protein LOC_Os03g21759 [Oryza sativa Japonica Group]